MGDSVTVIDNNPDVVVDENIINISTSDNTPNTISILDNTTSEITIVEQVTEVTVQGISPSITIEYGGTRGPIYTTESANFGSKELLAYLVNAVESSHLSEYLREQIDYSTTGLVEAREDLIALVEASGALEGRVDVAETSMTQTDYTIEQLANRVTSTEAGDIEAIQTKFTQTAEDLLLVAARFDTAENLITNAQLDIDSNAIRMTVAEESIDNNGLALISQMELLSNQWTVKIQEGTDSNYYAAGLGLTVYPDWVEGKNYYVDDWVMYDSLAYKCTNDHTSSDVLGPYWTYMPGGVKSTFGVLADQFFIQGASGENVVPFIVDVATGTIVLNSDTITSGVASFISYNDISDTPQLLLDLDSASAIELGNATIDIASLGIAIDAEELARVNAILDEQTARVEAIAVRVSAEALLDGKITDAEQATIDKATELTTAYELYTDTVRQAMADGEITDAETRAIAAAKVKADAALADAKLYTAGWSAQGADVTDYTTIYATTDSRLDTAVSVVLDDLVNNVYTINTTTIDGGKITTGSITSNKLAIIGVATFTNDAGYTDDGLASTAITNASSAQSTANTGVSNAATAQSKANSAYTLAGTKIAASQAAWAINNNTTLISGAKIITGSLVADSIYTKHLKVGNVTTEKVAANAVTQVYSSRSTSSNVSLSVTLEYGYTVCLFVTLNVSFSSIFCDGYFVTRDDITIFSDADLVTAQNSSISFTDSPGFGTHTYKIVCDGSISHINLSSMIILVHKR